MSLNALCIVYRYDDFKSFIAIDERPSLDQFAEELITRLENASARLFNEVNSWFAAAAGDNNKKKFSLWLAGKDHELLYWRLYDYLVAKSASTDSDSQSTNNNNAVSEDVQNAKEICFSYVTKAVNGRKGFDKLKELANNLNFKDFVAQNEIEGKKSKFSDWH
jgi:hypothetical protein